MLRLQGLSAYYTRFHAGFARGSISTKVLNHGSLDWRDVIGRITLPTLVIGGKHSHVNPQSQAWIHQQIPGARLEIFDQGGAHFMFIEAADQFNAVVRDFLA